MPRLRPRVIALVIVFPLLLIAFVGWLRVDDPLVQLQDWGFANRFGNKVPVWQVADRVISACLVIVALALVLGAVVVALRRARRERSWAAAGNVVAAAIVLISPAAVFFGRQASPDSQAPYLLALALGLRSQSSQTPPRELSPIAARPDSWSSQPPDSASCHWPHSQH
jgi:hypothetical protein